jgi:hypothetical protein
MARPSNDYEGAIRDALALTDSQRALERACAALRAALGDEIRRRPADAGLIAAHLAARLLDDSRALPAYDPGRPRGCRRVPRPEDLLAAFDASLAGEEEGAA